MEAPGVAKSHLPGDKRTERTVFMKESNFETIEDFLADASFRRWALGEAGDHVSFWENWLKQNPDKKELLEQSFTLVRGLPFSITEKKLEASMLQEEWQKLQQKGNPSSYELSAKSSANRFRVRRLGLKIAASLLLIIAAGFVIQQYVLNPLVRYSTPFGRQMSLVLPDSTTVELNANSILSFRKQNPRKVWLDGEAFFHVKKKEATGANFLVLTNDLTVEVLGTSFNVVEKKDKTEVILEEGSIRLNLKRDFEQELLMKPGDLVAFSARSDQNVEQRQVKTNVLTSWKDGVLEFEDTPLSEVMERIEAIYGWKTIYFDEDLKSRKISTPLPTEDLDSALLILERLRIVTIEKVEEDGKTLLLR